MLMLRNKAPHPLGRPRCGLTKGFTKELPVLVTDGFRKAFALCLRREAGFPGGQQRQRTASGPRHRTGRNTGEQQLTCVGRGGGRCT